MRSKWKIEDFELGKPLGYGKFGVVWLVKEKKSNYILALKIIKKKDIADDIKAIRQVRREIEIQMNIKSVFVLRMFGFFHDDINIYYMLEYAQGGELFSLLLKKGRYTDREGALITYQVIRGLQCMHEMGVIHRDLKPENILIGSDNIIKICDLGWAVCNVTKKRVTFCGTDEYLSPEIANKKNHSVAVDLWCLGILIYELLVGQTPFKSSSILSSTKDIKQTNLHFPRYISDDARDVLKKLLVIDPSKRLTLKQILDHNWIKKYLKGSGLDKL
ncbi:putative spindle assembly checkpoint kinase like protein [Cucumispora dikerogammari]|nr:putative spindle assembly checkpoint kinase like protein [Cucumispora dikerogammari]